MKFYDLCFVFSLSLFILIGILHRVKMCMSVYAIVYAWEMEMQKRECECIWNMINILTHFMAVR